MKDYASMSDFEINCRVHAEAMEISGLDSFKAKDYCNNPADAWPIITATGISLIKCTVDSVCWSAEIITDIDDVTDNLFQCQSSFDYQDENPLRCAMIVFLMMKEGEK